jgi:hypothetical protein
MAAFALCDAAAVERVGSGAEAEHHGDCSDQENAYLDNLH